MTSREHSWMRFETKIAPLDLAITLDCGQTFRWYEMEPGTWAGTIGKNFVRLTQSDGTTVIVTPSKDRAVVRAVREYLRADDDIAAIQLALKKDSVISNGMRKFRGLRIIKMDEWECLVSYVLATYANIPRIKKMIETLCTEYGERIPGGYAFPTIRRLGEAAERDLVKCGLGYRARYVIGLCQTLSTAELQKMKTLDFVNLKESLLELPGVGNKVADCVSLFGFGRLEAFPIDVWIERALRRLYHVRGSYMRMNEFASVRFGAYAGYAQEYLYFNERAVGKESACAFSSKRQNRLTH